MSTIKRIDLNRDSASDGRVEGATSEPSLVLVLGFRGVLGAGLRDAIGRDAHLRPVLADPDGDLAATVAKQRPELVMVWHEALATAIELRKLILAHPTTHVVVAVPGDDRERDDALRSAGAVVLPLTMDGHELRVALRLLADGVVGPPRLTAGNPNAGLGLLTPREAEVLELLAQRASVSEIAEALHVTRATVKTHAHHIYEKLGVHKRQDLARYAAEIASTEARGERVAQIREALPYRRTAWDGHRRDSAVVIDFCQALGARRWLGR